ncbi:MAG: heavy-metal-associated domain-containing protein [Sulfolobales archaeon]|nr:heavy-metal-associated domain-containing protein [Sulfolobales archaeon]
MRLRADREEVLKVVGMHCSTCVATVSRAASSVKGVKDVRVNLATGEVRLSLGERLEASFRADEAVTSPCTLTCPP